jgi:hypothetical protein
MLHILFLHAVPSFQLHFSSPYVSPIKLSAMLLDAYGHGFQFSEDRRIILGQVRLSENSKLKMYLCPHTKQKALECLEVSSTHPCHQAEIIDLIHVSGVLPTEKSRVSSRGGVDMKTCREIRIGLKSTPYSQFLKR